MAARLASGAMDLKKQDADAKNALSNSVAGDVSSRDIGTIVEKVNRAIFGYIGANAMGIVAFIR